MKPWIYWDSTSRTRTWSSTACRSRPACGPWPSRLGHDPEPWGLAGILHDLDYEVTEKSPELHTTETVKILREKGIDEPVIHAVQAHAGKVPCESPMDWAIYSVDPLTGLIIAATLMHPDEEDQVHRPRVRQAALQGEELRPGRPPRGDRGVPQPRPRPRRVPVDRHRGHAGDRHRPRPLNKEGQSRSGDSPFSYFSASILTPISKYRPRQGKPGSV